MSIGDASKQAGFSAFYCAKTKGETKTGFIS
jgi:hypothetical protein